MIFWKERREGKWIVNSVQEHLIKLLGEIDDICVSNGIPYVLYGRTARDAYTTGKFIGNYVFASVMMPSDSFERFQSLVQKEYPDERAVEWIVNNPFFPGMHMRYVDLNTTYFYGDSVYKYSYPGIYVTIERVRSIPSNKYKAKLANGIDKAIELTSQEDIETLSRIKKGAVTIVRCMTKLLSRKRALLHLIRFQNWLGRKHTSKMAIIRFLKDNIDISEKHLSEVVRIPFENRSFMVPKNKNAFLNLTYGTSWQANEPADIISPHLLVSSTEIPFRNIIRQDDILEIKKIEQVIQERSRVQNAMKPLDKRIQQYWKHLFLTRDRFNLFRKYYPHRQEISEYMKNYDIQVLQAMMQDVMALETEYIDTGLAMPVFDELDKIIHYLYIYQGDYKRANQFLNRSINFKKIDIVVDEDISKQDLDSWPLYLSISGENTFPVFVQAKDGTQYPVVYRTYDKDYLNIFTFDGNNITVAIPIEGSVIVALEETREISLQEIFEKCCSDIPYVRLFYMDYSRRCFEFGCLTEDGSILVTALFNDLQYIGTNKLPPRVQRNKSRSIECTLFLEKEALGSVYWRENKTTISPALGYGRDGLIRAYPHSASAELMCCTTDGQETPVTTIFSDKKTSSTASLWCQSIYGEMVKIADLSPELNINPLVRFTESGFIEDYQNGAEILLELPPEDLPLYLQYDLRSDKPTYYGDNGKQYEVVFNAEQDSGCDFFVLSADKH